MSDRSVEHDTFTITRRYAAAPERVFAAWADPQAKAQWFGAPDGAAALTLDFRVGGTEQLGASVHEGRTYTYDATYYDIVDGRRIVYAYDMTMDGERISISLSTVQFDPDGEGTAMTYTEQGAYLDGHDQPAIRAAGTRGLFDALAKALGEPAAV